MVKDDLFVSDNSDHISNSPMMNAIQVDFSPKSDKLEEKIVLYLDLFTSNEIRPYFIVSFREYILVVRINKRYQIKPVSSLTKEC